MPQTHIEPRIRVHARHNRLVPTAGERAMWKYLKAFRASGVHFRRQAAIGNYIADFAWLSARLVIEIDGGTHDSEAVRKRDTRKNEFLAREGFAVIRVSNDDVVANAASAFARIEEAISRCMNTPPLPPHKGEGNRAFRLDTPPQPLPTRGRGFTAASSE